MRLPGSSLSPIGLLLAVLLSILGAVPGAGSGTAKADDAGADLIGKAAPGWEGAEWIQGGPLSLDELRGRVVLVRWWTGPDCPYCSKAAPDLNSWHERYGSRGLVVIGFYHHKSPEPLKRADVVRLAETFGFAFPIAIDPDWRTLHLWWLDGHDRPYTSVTFLIDREGVIRYVHPGGSYSRAEAGTIESRIRELLRDAGPAE